MWTQAVGVEETEVANISPFRVSEGLVCDNAAFAAGELR